MSRPARAGLIRDFERCLAYKRAPRWRKPLLDPRRFLANQLRTRLGLGLRPGALREVRTFHLDALAIVSGERVGEEIASYGVFEPALTSAFLRLVEPGQVVVDVGTHVGYYTTLLARLVGETGEVHAFEPTPSTREVALRNVSRFPQVRLHEEAVWSGPGQLPFRDYGTQWLAFNSATGLRAEADLPAPRELVVPATTLDALRSSLSRPVALVKVDAEGAEEQVLSGARRLLETDRPLVTLEVGDHPGGPPSRRRVEQLRAAGFEPWDASADGRFVPHVSRESYAYDNLVFAPRERPLA